MKTWNEKLKAHWMPIFESHHAADRYIQGLWEWITEEKDAQGMHRGCAFGCSLQTKEDVFEESEKQMHLPGWLVHLIERTFEKLPKEEAPDFFLDVMRAIPCNADIENVKHAIAIRRLTPLLENNPSCSEAIQAVIDCHKNWQTCKKDEWENAREEAAWAWEFYRSREAWSAKWSAKGRQHASAIFAVESCAPELQDDAWRREAENLIEELNKVER